MDDQAAGLRREMGKTNTLNQGKTISIVSGKGGVGKSNIALNFSVELLKKEKKVLLIDLDIGMGNIEILLGLHAQKTIVNMFDEHLPINEIIEKGPNNLSFISGGSALSNLFMMDQEKADYFFEQYNELVQTYDYIIFDHGAGVSQNSLHFILASDECIVVTTPEPTSITDAYGMIKHIINNQQTMPIYVIMNRSTSQKNGMKALNRFKDIIYRFLHVDVQMLGLLPDDRTVSTAVNRQIPFVLLNEKSAISKAVQQITENYLVNAINPERHKPFSFIRKLKQLLKER